MEEVKLYRKNSIGIGTWRISGAPTSANQGVVNIAHTVVEGGSEVFHQDVIKTNCSGRSVVEQIRLEMNSRISRARDKGYKSTREEALLGSTNQLGLLNPMLALPLNKVRIVQSDFDGAFVQLKYNGHRCLITKQGGDMLAYSRKGNAITTVPHILEALEPVMQDGDTFDGELYIHGMRLQTISSLIKRQQEGSRLLNFLWYDMVTDEPYGLRFRTMSELKDSVAHPQIQLAPTEKVTRMAEVYAHFKKARVAGYEGSMLRLSRAGYEANHRSDQLIKVKEREDCEVTVKSGRPAANGGAILTVVTDWGTTFDIMAPGSLQEKQRVMEKIGDYLEKRLTIEYAELTADKIPFHAVAIQWWEDV